MKLENPERSPHRHRAQASAAGPWCWWLKSRINVVDLSDLCAALLLFPADLKAQDSPGRRPAGLACACWSVPTIRWSAGPRLVPQPCQWSEAGLHALSSFCLLTRFSPFPSSFNRINYLEQSSNESVINFCRIVILTFSLSAVNKILEHTLFLFVVRSKCSMTT